MMNHWNRLLAFWLLLVCQAGAQISQEAVGNVTTTSFALCWETDVDSVPDVQVFSDAAGTVEITSQLMVERQFVSFDRREINGGTPGSRGRSRDVQAAMTSRHVYLVKISGATPGQDYWVKAVARDSGGTALDSSDLLSVTTASRAEFVKEARQIVVDFSTASATSGDLAGMVIRVSDASSPYPLFAVVGDGGAAQQAYFDLNHFLDATGETQLMPASGTTLDLTVSFIGGTLSGTFTGNEIAYDGSYFSTRTSVVDFVTGNTVNLVATPARATALSGYPFSVSLAANDGGGLPLAGFNTSLTLTSAALTGGSLVSDPLGDGVLADQAVVLSTLGNQTVTVTDPLSGATTDFSVNVLEYNYDNFRLHYYGDLVSAEGEAGANGDGDEYDNFAEFSYGLDPLINEDVVQYGADGGVIQRGGPDVVLRVDSNGVDLRVTFLRPKNYAALGIQYIPEISSSLGGWYAVSAPPVVIGEENEMELVSVPYPYFTPEPRKARFFRIRVTIP